MSGDELDRLVAQMRRLGVLALKTKDIELALGPAPLEPVRDEAPVPPVDKEVKPRKDGLSPELQVELYGREYT